MEEKDKTISKLNQRISDLEMKIKRMEGMVGSPKILKTDYSKDRTIDTSLVTKDIKYMITSTNEKPNNKNKSLPKYTYINTKQKQIYKNNILRTVTNSQLIADSTKEPNFELFKPLVPTIKSTNKNRTSLYFTNIINKNKNLNKSNINRSIKTSFDKSYGEHTYNNSPKHLMNRHLFLSKEITNESRILSTHNVLETDLNDCHMNKNNNKNNNKLTDRLNIIKERAKQILNKYNKNNETLVKHIKKNCHSKSLIY
jgi:hypothetical protein